MALGDFSHRGSGVGQATDQGDALSGETGVVVAEHLAQDPPHCIPDGLGVAGFAGRVGFRFWQNGWVVSLTHERTVGGVTFGGAVAVMGDVRAC